MKKICIIQYDYNVGAVAININRVFDFVRAVFG